MSIPRSASHRLRRQSQWIGVVLLLLVYMAQPVLAISSALCGCSGIGVEHACGCGTADEGPLGSAQASSCCSERAPMAAPSNSAESLGQTGPFSGAETEAYAANAMHSVCQCQHDPVDPTPSGVIFDGQAFEGPFAWWAALEAHAQESRLMPPHLGNMDAAGGRLDDRSRIGPPGPSTDSDGGGHGPATRRLCTDGLIAFLANLCEANL